LDFKERRRTRDQGFEVKGLRRIMRVSWKTKETDEWIMEQAGVQRSLLESVTKNKLKYCGHVLRKKESCLEKDIVEGTMPGARSRGRP
jgi:hypothetical protein